MQYKLDNWILLSNHNSMHVVITACSLLSLISLSLSSDTRILNGVGIDLENTNTCTPSPSHFSLQMGGWWRRKAI